MGTDLGALIPGSGRLVHMPSHIYLRVGLYNDAAISNVEAVEADEKYIETEAPQGIYRMMSYPHNIDFLWAAQHMQGRSAEAIETARKLAERTPPVEEEFQKTWARADVTLSASRF